MTMQLPLIGNVQKSSPWLIGLLAAGLVGTGTAGALYLRSQSRVPDIAGMTVTVEAQDLTVRITASGKVQPVQTVNLSPQAAGILEELFVEQGDRVEAGQVIARMRSNDISPQLNQARARVAQARARLERLRSGNRPQEIAQARANVEQARATVEQARSRLMLANERVERNQLLANEGAISRDRLDEVLNEARTAQANFEQAQASLREAQQRLELSQSGSRTEDIREAEAQLAEAIANLESVQVREDETFIRAPFSGIITQKYATEGAFVTPTTSASEATSATSTAIVALAQGLEVLAEVPEVDIGQIQVGQMVEIRADALPEQIFQGRVKVVAPEAVVRQNVTTFQVRVELISGQDKLLSGMNVNLTFLGDRLPQALVVPTVAIVTQDGQPGVLVPDARNRPEFRPITLGTGLGDQTQVLEGLKAGDRVFIDLPAEERNRWMRANEE